MEKQYTPLEVYLAELLADCCGEEDVCPCDGIHIGKPCPHPDCNGCENTTTADWLRVLEKE